jgi:hypothetical protein
VAINLTSDRPWLQEAKLDLTRILVPLEAGKLFRFPNLWGDEGSHYVHLNHVRKQPYIPGVSRLQGAPFRSPHKPYRAGLSGHYSGPNARHHRLPGRDRRP